MTVGTDRRGRLRQLADRIRKIPNARYGTRPHTVTLVQTLWSDPTDQNATSTPILNGGENPKVRFLTLKERYAADLQQLSIEVGPITPEFDGGGYSAETLRPMLNGQETGHYLVTGPGMGPDGSIFALRELKVDRALGYRLVMELSGTGKETR